MGHETSGVVTREFRFLTTEDGEPWAVFTRGHIDRRTVKREDLLKAMGSTSEDYAEVYDQEYPGRPVIEHFYLTNKNINDDYEPFEETFWFCGKGDAGAFPVTGVRLT